jgi:hypothetical protein
VMNNPMAVIHDRHSMIYPTGSSMPFGSPNKIEGVFFE